jgi:2-hydroxychromene-2-carboxylate isomerase
MAAPVTTPMPAPVEFWFDFASPYGYLLSEKIDALAARHGRSTRWRPMLLFAVLRVLDLPAPLGNVVKRAYMLRDFERSARFLEVPYRMPDGFPAVTQHAARAFHLIDRIDPAAAVRFAHVAMRGYFRDGAPIGDAQAVAGWAAQEAPALGSLQDIHDQLRGAEAKSLLAHAVDEAVRRNVFGSPFVFVDDEPFFGADRLPQIEAALMRSGAHQAAATPS